MYIKDNRLNLQYYNNDKFKLSSENDNFHTKLQPFSNFNGEIKMISKRWSVNRTDRYVQTTENQYGYSHRYFEMFTNGERFIFSIIGQWKYVIN